MGSGENEANVVIEFSDGGLYTFEVGFDGTTTGLGLFDVIEAETTLTTVRDDFGFEEFPEVMQERLRNCINLMLIPEILVFPGDRFEEDNVLDLQGQDLPHRLEVVFVFGNGDVIA